MWKYIVSLYALLYKRKPTYMLKQLLIIILSFITINLFAQAKAEKISIFWPIEDQLVFEGKEKKGNEFTEYYLPRKSSRKKWKMLGTIKTYRNIQTKYTDSIWVAYKKSILAHSSEATFTPLEKDTSVKTY